MDSICFPDYNHSILNISATLLHYYGASSLYGDLEALEKELEKHPKNIILMIFDGMGTNILQKNLPKDSVLRKYVKDEITSVFPPTTTAATTTYYSGKTPIEHAWLGWMCYFKKYGQVIELFKNKNFYTGEKVDINVVEELPYVTIYDQIKKATNNVVETHSIFPKKVKEDGYQNMEELKNKILDITSTNNEKFILTYCQYPDSVIHRKGTASKETKDEIEKINEFVENIKVSLKDTLLIISADHGLIDVDEEIYIENYPDFKDCLAQPLSLEDRTCAVFLKPEKKQEFISLFERYFSNDFILFPLEMVVKKELFGPAKVNPSALEFIGDFLIVSKSRKSLRQQGPNDEQFKAAHAGLLKAEMMVPLILIECR